MFFVGSVVIRNEMKERESSAGSTTWNWQITANFLEITAKVKWAMW